MIHSWLTANKSHSLSLCDSNTLVSFQPHHVASKDMDEKCCFFPSVLPGGRWKGIDRPSHHLLPFIIVTNTEHLAYGLHCYRLIHTHPWGEMQWSASWQISNQRPRGFTKPSKASLADMDSEPGNVVTGLMALASSGPHMGHRETNRAWKKGYPEGTDFS